MDNVYLKMHSDLNPCLVPIETAVALFLIKYTDSTMNINLVMNENENENKNRNKPENEYKNKNENENCLKDRSFKINIKALSSIKIVKSSELPESAKFCELPNIVEFNGGATVAGLCAILRRIIKQNESQISLLGFKSSCLLACSEVSVWTKFCEVDIIQTLKLHSPTSEMLPESLARFERHLEQPVRLHNLYKYTNSKKCTEMHEVSRDESGNPDHSFAEGSSLTLSDLIIFVCVHLLIKEVLPARILTQFPFMFKWYNKLMQNDKILDVAEMLFGMKADAILDEEKVYVVPEVENKSLYKSDQKRYKPKNKIYTRQEEVEYSLEMVQKHDLDVTLSPNPFAFDEIINRDEIPYEATPQGGALPIARLERKFQQLENLCRPVLKLAKPGDTVVDFCSGSGHLGILIACLLPDCKVVLLENKEESLKIARERVEKLQLKNVRFCQCNLDYFRGHFDIGINQIQYELQ